MAPDYRQLVLTNADPGTTYLDREGRLCLGDEDAWVAAILECDAYAQDLQKIWTPLENHIDKLCPAFENCAITLLVDQSGSMRGETIRHLAASLRWLSVQFERRKISHEILGFTTVRWKGGKSREKWLAEGKQPYPGRLNDLLHIVYKAMDETITENDFETMLHPNLIKENVDGEALQWALERLDRSSKSQKLLLMISDGAPVDDSTLSANGPSVMERHLFEVIDKITSNQKISLGGVGIGYDVSRYYSNSLSSDDLTKIPAMIIDVCSRLAEISKN